MADEELARLKKSRGGLKSVLTRVRNAALQALHDHVAADDPHLLEQHLALWEQRLRIFQDADTEIKLI